MVIFNTKKIDSNKRVFFYKSSINQSGNQSISWIHVVVLSEEFHKTLVQIFWIVENILSGEPYSFTSKPSSQANLGKIKIEITIITKPKREYLIELIAGFIFSSLPPDSIKSNPHHKINQIEKIQAARTIKDIVKRMKSQSSICEENIGAELTFWYADANNKLII